VIAPFRTNTRCFNCSATCCVSCNYVNVTAATIDNRVRIYTAPDATPVESKRRPKGKYWLPKMERV